MIYTKDEIKAKVKMVEDNFDIEEILLFGSYFDHVPNEQSDVDLLVKYGAGCNGMERIQFMLDLENKLQKKVDVINIKFAPEFIADLDLKAEGRLIYAK